MPTLPMFQVDAFTGQLFSGNPAAVLVLDRALDEGLMQKIATENNLSETAFAVARPDGDWDLRWFTPALEVEFCGHATLATAHTLVTEHHVSGTITFHTRAGALHVTKTATGYDMDFPARLEQPLNPLPEIWRTLFPEGTVHQVIAGDNYIAELPDEEAVLAYQPDVALITTLHPYGLAITARGQECDFVSRYFVPSYGILEDPVTGSLHAALTPYWAKRLGKSSMQAIQRSARGGHIDCTLKGDRVILSGQAVTYLRGMICLPN